MKIYWKQLLVFSLIWISIGSFLIYLEIPEWEICLIAFIYGLFYPGVVFEVSQNKTNDKK